MMRGGDRGAGFLGLAVLRWRLGVAGDGGVRWGVAATGVFGRLGLAAWVWLVVASVNKSCQVEVCLTYSFLYVLIADAKICPSTFCGCAHIYF